MDSWLAKDPDLEYLPPENLYKYYCEKCKSKHRRGSKIHKEHMKYGHGTYIVKDWEKKIKDWEKKIK